MFAGGWWLPILPGQAGIDSPGLLVMLNKRTILFRINAACASRELSRFIIYALNYDTWKGIEYAFGLFFRE